MNRASPSRLLVVFSLFVIGVPVQAQGQPEIGREIAIPHHLQDGEEFKIPMRELITYGSRLFNAKFTIQEGVPHQNSLIYSCSSITVDGK